MSLPTEVDLRLRFAERGLEPRSQGSRGTCSIFAVAGVLEYELGRPERLSVEYLNWASHQTNNRRVDGSFFSDALEGIRRFGICAEERMPYAAQFDPDAKPSDAAHADAKRRRSLTSHWVKEWDVRTGLSDAQIAAVKRLLADGHPVAVGLRWPKTARYAAGNRLVQPPPADVFDGHSIVLVGYADDPKQDGGGTFLFRNSSGPGWEDRGYARFSYDYARAYANDAVAITVR